MTIADTVVKVVDEVRPMLLSPELPPDLIVADADTSRRRAAVAPPAARTAPPRLLATVIIEPVHIQSTAARATIAGRLEARLGGGPLMLTGQIGARRGTVTLLDQRYELRRASLAFDGSADPIVDVLLSRTVSEATLHVAVIGRASDPELELSSDPPMFSKAQLLSFMLGATPNASPGDESREAGASLAGALLSQRLQGAVDDVLPIDVLRIETATPETPGSVALGKWITRNLLVALRSRFGDRPDRNTSQAEIEYWLAENVLLEAFAGDRGVFGADLLWVFRR